MKTDLIMHCFMPLTHGHINFYVTALDFRSSEDKNSIYITLYRI